MNYLYDLTIKIQENRHGMRG